jgi:signal transduction histidine kinase
LPTRARVGRPDPMRPLGIRTRLVLGALSILAPMLAVVAHGYGTDLELRRELVISDLSQTADASAALVERTFDGLLALALTAASDPEFRERDPARLEQALDRLMRYRSDVMNMGVFDRSGRVIAVAGEREGAPDIQDRPYFQRVLQTGESTLSPLLFGRFVERPIVIGASPLRDDGGIQGVVTAVLRLAAVEEQIEQIELRRGQAIFLLDPTGRMAFHTSVRDLSWEERDFSSNPNVKVALAGQRIVLDRAVGLAEPMPRAMILQPMHRYGWVVGVSWPEVEAFGPLRKAQRERSILLAGIALVTLLASLGFAAYFSAPVRRLVSAVRAFGAGDATRRVPVLRRDELGDLANAFNRMADRLVEEQTKRERFISAIAHDMANVMTPLLASSELLRRKLGGAHEGSARLLQRIDQQARRANRLVSDLLDVSRVEAGRFSIQSSAHDLSAVIRQVVDEQRLATGRTLLLEAPEHLELDGDPDRLAQVVTNLVSNAVKYSPPESEVRIVLTTQDGRAELRVSDRGLGLTTEQIAALFDPYSRVHADARVPGLGMGLFISRAIVLGHHGSIDVQSAGPGEGATFVVRLPLRKA